ncbi:unnamed protein product, partial [Tetraodon nigroviridis]
ELERLNQVLEEEKLKFEEVVMELKAEQEHIKQDLDGTARSLRGVESEKEELSTLTRMLQKSIEELSQEKQRTLELLGVKEKEEEDAEESPAGGDGGDVDLLKDLQHIEEEMKVLLKEKEQAEEKLKDNEQMAKVLQEEREFYWSQAQTLQQSLTQLSVDKRQTEAELQLFPSSFPVFSQAEIESRAELEQRLKEAEEALQELEKGLNSLERSTETEEQMKGNVTQLRRFFEECICAAEIEAKLPSIMKNAVYLHKAAARRIKSCRIQRRASRHHWCKSSADAGVSADVNPRCAPVAVKHSKSFVVTDADDRSMEELRETARRLTSDSSFRQTVYKIMARQDAAS